MVFLANPFLCAVVCIGKGTLSGWCAGLVYRLVARKDAALGRNAVAVLLAAITAPVVNTGVFLLGMVLSYVLETPSGASVVVVDLVVFLLFCGVQRIQCRVKK